MNIWLAWNDATKNHNSDKMKEDNGFELQDFTNIF